MIKNDIDRVLTRLITEGSVVGLYDDSLQPLEKAERELVVNAAALNPDSLAAVVHFVSLRTLLKCLNNPQ